MTSEMSPLPRFVAGARPGFHTEPAIDRLVAMVLALTREVSMLRDRVDTLEVLGQQAGWLGAEAVETYVPPLPVRQRREAGREAMISRVLAIMAEEIADLEAGETDDSYWATVSGIEKGEV
ncbi:MAG: hypothetical protein RL480_757 [Pseudomonadota bacterium]|jgi:6-phosphofructokinase